MITQTEYLRSIHDGQIDYAKNEGREEERIEIAIEMLSMGLSKEQVSRATKLSIDVILEIESKLQ